MRKSNLLGKSLPPPSSTPKAKAKGSKQKQIKFDDFDPVPMTAEEEEAFLFEEENRFMDDVGNDILDRVYDKEATDYGKKK